MRIFRRVSRDLGKTGEHYLARTRQEYFRAFQGGAGAGGVTAMTVILKFLISVSKLPLLAETLLSGVNYGGSFLLMQGLGFRLATKQPALVAVTLARRIGAQSLTQQVLAITRSQFAAVLGNFGLVVPALALFHLGYYLYAGKAFLSPDVAVKSLTSLNPFAGGTLLYAALTGALLWCSSLVSGFVHHGTRRVRIATHFRSPSPWKRGLWRALSRHSAGIGFNLSLGVLLAVTPMLGKALALPIDVRHFTLSSGALTLSACSLGWAQAWQLGLVPATFGVLLIGLLNFAVSFLLSFFLALFSRGIHPGRIAAPLSRVFSGFMRKPLEFLLPPAPMTDSGSLK